MNKFFIGFFCAFFVVAAMASDCIKYKVDPIINIQTPEHNVRIIQPDEPMDKVHGITVSTWVEDYNISAEVFSVFDGLCIRIRGVDATIGYNNFLVKIDRSHKYESCSYNAVLNHEQKHIDADLSVMRDMEVDIKNSVFNAVNSVMPVFVETQDDAESAIEQINNQIQKHPEVILMKQKVEAAQEIRNKRIDQDEDHSELRKCGVMN